MADVAPAQKSDRLPHPLSRKIEQFIRQVDGLAETLPFVFSTLNGARKTVSAEEEKLIAEHATSYTKDGWIWVTPEPDYYWAYQKLRRRRHQAVSASRTVPRSFVVALVSVFDAFVGQLLRELFVLQPGLLAGSERTLTLSQLSQFASLDEARDYILEKEVEAVLRESHAEQFDWMERKFKLELRKDLAAWPLFIELTERRNLFVHTDGKVSSQYLQVCASHAVDLSDDVKIRRQLTVTQEYFASACRCVLEIGVKLAHVLWRKLDPSTRAEADQNLNSIVYELVADERYPLACCFADFATETLKKFSSDEYRRYLVLNRAQAYKWNGNVAKTYEIVNGEDWSACGDEFKLAVALLRDDLAAAMEVVEKIGGSGAVKKVDYRHWPIFRDLRKHDAFVTFFEKTFGEPLNQLTDTRLEVEAQSTPEGAA